MSTENEGAGTPEQPPAGASGPHAALPGPPPRPAALPPGQPAAPAPPPAPPASSYPPPSPYHPAPPAPAPVPQGPPPPAPGFASEAAAPPAPPEPGASPEPYPGDPGGAEPAAPWAAVPPPPPPPRRRAGLLAAVVVATLVAGGIGGGVGYLVADADDSPPAVNAPLGRDGDEAPVARPPDSVAGIAEAALPSVVTIEAGTEAEGSTGTGFVYDEEGHILTNNHVVASGANGGTVTATFSDGESYEAEIVGRAEGYDVAVLRILDLQGRELEPLPMGDSDAVAVGDATIAIGAPFGLSGTVTTGIVSAKDRPLASSDGQSGSSSYMNALQTDASINPGNSGGPLLNADGAVIGINSAIRSTSGGMGEAGSIGLGFAIPINQATRVAQDLIETGEPVYAIIGASVDSGDGSVEGAHIVESTTNGSDPLTPGGPADQAGLQPGDVITRFGDVVIDSSPTLVSQIWTYQPGDRVEVTYLRDGEERTTTLTLGERVGD
ncbi:trypsin-like peptidase domain-containing protein [Streptomyces sp. DSM 44917]|uniref:Trypsin-like peptidase domain-containing protein n=1 Tax=Streptomyces boetiae TaxID=3075541 RepID=A0ABU2LE26_9ACTN|nr:trypsin-like peptidase domain-containing protein [Streptomyces sp. DSM 44917]MDT0309839.1 trypsin-like peptidase domain-containing protein [Streptomyces sp. DSM 44917]